MSGLKAKYSTEINFSFISYFMLYVLLNHINIKKQFNLLGIAFCFCFFKTPLHQCCFINRLSSLTLHSLQAQVSEFPNLKIFFLFSPSSLSSVCFSFSNTLTLLTLYQHSQTFIQLNQQNNFGCFRHFYNCFLHLLSVLVRFYL